MKLSLQCNGTVTFAPRKEKAMSAQHVRHTAMSMAALLPDNHKEAVAVLTEMRELVDWQVGSERRPLLKIVRTTPGPRVKSWNFGAGLSSRARVSVIAAVSACIISLGIGWMIEPPWAGAGHQCAYAGRDLVFIAP